MNIKNKAVLVGRKAKHVVVSAPSAVKSAPYRKMGPSAVAGGAVAVTVVGRPVSRAGKWIAREYDEYYGALSYNAEAKVAEKAARENRVAASK